jgi:hypothetical protein
MFSTDLVSSPLVRMPIRARKTELPAVLISLRILHVASAGILTGICRP